jgi:hypothetical protein
MIRIEVPVKTITSRMPNAPAGEDQGLITANFPAYAVSWMQAMFPEVAPVRWNVLVQDTDTGEVIITRTGRAAAIPTDTTIIGMIGLMAAAFLYDYQIGSEWYEGEEAKETLGEAANPTPLNRFSNWINRHF